MPPTVPVTVLVKRGVVPPPLNPPRPPVGAAAARITAASPKATLCNPRSPMVGIVGKLQSKPRAVTTPITVHGRAVNHSW